LLNPHLHVLVLDGVYTVTDDGVPAFHGTPPPSNDDVARLNEVIAQRVRRFLLRSGRFTEACEHDDNNDDALAPISQAAVYGTCAQERTRQTLLGKHPDLAAEVTDRRCTRYLGFSLHADVRISQLCPDRLERLVRYVARGPICNDRLDLTSDGRVVYKFKRKWKNGARAVVLSPTAFIERLCALIPRPRRPLITYHGVLAPAARLRPAIVPTPEPPDPTCSHEPTSRTSNPKPKPPKRRGQRRYYSWAELIRRVFLTDVLVCPRCNGRRRVLAAITDPATIRQILEHLSLPATPPAITPARSPPGFDCDYGA